VCEGKRKNPAGKEASRVKGGTAGEKAIMGYTVPNGGRRKPLVEGLGGRK